MIKNIIINDNELIKNIIIINYNELIKNIIINDNNFHIKSPETIMLFNRPMTNKNDFRSIFSVLSSNFGSQIIYTENMIQKKQIKSEIHGKLTNCHLYLQCNMDYDINQLCSYGPTPKYVLPDYDGYYLLGHVYAKMRALDVSALQTCGPNGQFIQTFDVIFYDPIPFEKVHITDVVWSINKEGHPLRTKIH